MATDSQERTTPAGRGGAWAPLRVRQFRTLWSAQFVSNVGGWMQVVGAQWLMLSLTASTTALGLVYLRATQDTTPRQGLILGVLWAAISLAIDLPLVLPPPMSVPPGEYLADVAATYLMMPVITSGLAAAQRHAQAGGV